MLKKKLITCALPYANGPIHLGHLLEQIQADIWVRYQRMRGDNVYFICADDAHGTPIMIKVDKLGVNPENFIQLIYQEHKNDLFRFGISYDNYYTTHSKENKELSYIIYQRLKKNGLIKSRIISQLYDPEKDMFMPDRFISGKCPKCYSINQYGDSCEECGSIYNQTDLINPKSIISGSTLILRKSEHFFFDLPVFSDMLYNWIHSGVLQKQVINKLYELFASGLQQWDISRDAPYFGFEFPDIPNKYFYVWLDAPIGYISTFKNLCNKHNDICFEKFWNKDFEDTTDLYHFIGKDIIYFHCLFWPAILQGSNLRKPTNIFVHGYVTVNGYKMSKSRGTFIKASTYLKYLDPDCLRYYYATKLSSRIDDIDLNFEDLMKRFNSDIVNKIVNLAARNASFINKYFNNQLSTILENIDLYNIFINASDLIGDFFQKREYNNAIKEIIKLADLANCYIDEKAPWRLVKQINKYQSLQDICSMGIQLFRVLMIYLKPVLPFLSERVENFLNLSLTWENIKNPPLTPHKINSFKELFKRIQYDQIKSILIDANKDKNLNN